MCDISITMDRMQIADYLAKKVFNGELELSGDYITLKNKQIYSDRDYGRLVESNKISPEDAFVYIYLRDYGVVEPYNRLTVYLFPLIGVPSISRIADSYLDKLGFYEPDYYYVYPAMGLKYYAEVVFFSDRLVIEIVDIDTVVTNIGLRKIVMDVLGKDIPTLKKLSFSQRYEIDRKLREQKLFVGHTLGETYDILKDYYQNHNTSLAKEVLAIINDYNRIFQPYRVVYDTRTRQQVLM